jgi:hypothetical protein
VRTYRIYPQASGDKHTKQEQKLNNWQTAMKMSAKIVQIAEIVKDL